MATLNDLAAAEADLKRMEAENKRLRAALTIAQQYLPHVRPEAPVEGLMAAQRLIAEALEHGGSRIMPGIDEKVDDYGQ